MTPLVKSLIVSPLFDFIALDIALENKFMRFLMKENIFESLLSLFWQKYYVEHHFLF